jgi:hypothetical protein
MALWQLRVSCVLKSSRRAVAIIFRDDAQLFTAPQNPRNSAVQVAPPQETHGRNGIPRHTSAQLLISDCQP